MKMLNTLLAATIIAGSALAAVPAIAQTVTIAENQNGPSNATAGTYYLGQSFTVDGTGSFSNVTANLYGTSGAVSAPGSLYIYSSDFAGTESQLGTANAALLGSAVGSAGFYSFGSALTLTGGTKYFAYSNALSPQVKFSGNNPYATGNAYQAASSSGSFVAITSADLRFRVTATAAAVPEPATWGLMIVGFGMIGAASRGRKVKTTVAYA